MRGQKKTRAAELRRTALYVVWSGMLRKARREGQLLRRLGLSKEYMPVDPLFRDFAKFALWARLSAGYTIGIDDDKFIARKDKRGRWEPDNCFFTKDTQDDRIAELEYEITRGSKAEYKHNIKGKWCGLSNTRLYNIWRGMCRRCTDPNQKDYPDYGGRGISVCDSWRKDFFAFHDWAWDHGYSSDLSIDRIDVNANYCPENCRWASFIEQKLNTRKYNGKYINLRFKASKMKSVLDRIPDDVVVTLVVRSDCISDVNEKQDDYPAVPVEYRQDFMIGLQHETA